MHQQKGNFNSYSSGSQSYKIITQYGDMLVVKQGNTAAGAHQPYHQAGNNSPSSQAQQQQQQQQQQQTRPVIMTFHDLGLNSELQFAGFCECDEVKLMLQTFTVLHVNFIGQELEAERLSSDFKYPSVEQLAECIVDVCAHLRVRSFIGLAVGAGAHIVSLLALQRPDLVDGLFLINPVVTSCSITEWLYFKMSAIASNHTLASSHHHEHHRHSHSHSHSHNHSRHHQHKYQHSQVGSISPTHDTSSSSSKQTSTGGGSGLKRLINAASSHIHLPHLHHHNNNNSSSSSSNADQTTSDNLATSGKQLEEQPLDPAISNVASSETESTLSQNTENDTRSLTGSCASSLSVASSGPLNKPASGSRLRRLILSRNFRLGGQNRGSSSAKTGSSSTANSTTAELNLSSGALSSAHNDRKASAGSSGSSNGSQRSLASKGDGSISSSLDRRPPYEYLMYHHFGPTTFQRYRRSSGCLHTPEGERSSLTGSGEADSHSSQDDTSSALSLNKQQTADQLSRVRTNACSRSHDSLASAGNSGSVPTVLRARSGSLCMSSTYLASFSSERHKHAYMHSVYKHYFAQVSSHNLWLFAQSFAKRRALNLRKDCGAAAHAAAAAAALGTSICTAFVGMSASSGAEMGVPSSDPTHSHQAGEISATSNEKQQQQSNIGQASADQQQQRSNKALVAGTKVRRTFTCQTLIMCSSVQMHCERSFKLMSLLNPLQATWIKTDQLLILEEKPEKVCQALRLFLQGIGYSMSTYERRLRLSSTTGSAGSNDSSGSMRSLNNERIYA